MSSKSGGEGRLAVRSSSRYLSPRSHDLHQLEMSPGREQDSRPSVG